MRLSLINAHGGMQCSATPKGTSFAQTLPRVSVLSFKERSGNQTNAATEEMPPPSQAGNKARCILAVRFLCAGTDN